MKKIKLANVFACCTFIICTIVIDGCTKKNNTTTTPKCSTMGTSVNIGTSTGGTYAGGVGPTYNVYFNNTNLNFSVEAGQGVYGTIMDVGQQSCLDFSYTGTPVASVVAYKKGEGYVGLYKDGHIVKFIAISYNSGIAMIDYVFQ